VGDHGERNLGHGAGGQSKRETATKVSQKIKGSGKRATGFTHKKKLIELTPCETRGARRDCQDRGEILENLHRKDQLMGRKKSQKINGREKRDKAAGFGKTNPNRKQR